MKWAVVTLLVHSVSGQGYGPDPVSVPADFLCGWRRLALNYTKQVRPDAVGMAYDALELNKYCGDRKPASSKNIFPPSENPTAEKIIYVDAIHGSDKDPGSFFEPKRTAQAALQALRASKHASSAIVFRAGTHFMEKPLELTSQDVNLTLQNYPGEEVWLSGAQTLTDLKWKEYDVQPAKDVVLPNTNNARGCAANNPKDLKCGCQELATAQSCQAACNNETSCSSWTYHDAQTGKTWARKCCLRRDRSWEPFAQAHHTSGYRTLGRNVWQADLSAYSFSTIPELRVDGARVTPARFPNANVEKDIWPVGYLTSQGSDWLAPKISPKPNPAHVVNVSAPNRDWDDYFSHYGGGIGGTCSLYEPPFSYWCQDTFPQGCGGCFTWNIPGGLKFGDKLGNKTYKHIENAVIFAWRRAHWANWAFELESYHPANSTFIFGKGGFQGARGGPGSDWYISHVLEELDAPTEYYYSPSTKQLYYFPDQNTHGAPPASTRFEAVVQNTLVRAIGTQADPVKSLRVVGLGFRDTASTMLEPHGVPSGGDWALERMAAVFLEGVEAARVEKVKMWKIGGNGLMLSKFSWRSSVVDSEFVWLGGTAVAAWGWTDEISDGGIHGIDGTGGDFPRYTTIERNVFHEIGIWEKQASGFFQAKAAQTTLRHNVAFNLARAGFNFNDGFGGGDEIVENVLFNTCRESSDHGPINSWDRQPFLTSVRNGTPSTQMAWRDVRHNIVIANYGGSKEVDNDDGSLFYRVHHNFMAYGWAQKFKCGGIESFNNVKAFIDTGGKFDAGCTTHPNHFYPNLWHDDTMVHLGASHFPYRQCWGSDSAGHNWDKSQVHNNTIYMDNQGHHAMIQCHGKKIPLAKFQANGDDPGSREFHGYPSTNDILRWARSTIGEQWTRNNVKAGGIELLV